MSPSTRFERIPFRIHPRIFAALGADLVTNDVVAAIELVKNSYDAFSENVWIRFNFADDGSGIIEIEDDGLGMSRDVIHDVWCIVATPFKEDNPLIRSGKEVRRVVGQKGLGRLSAARLGNKLQIITKAPKSNCLELEVDWTDLAKGDDISSSYVNIREYSGDSPFAKSGTLLKIYDLNSSWDEDKIQDLEENLGRLISPFSQVGDFNIFLSLPGESESEKLRIEPPEFLNKPKYSISGKVDNKGNIIGNYRFAPITDGKVRTKKLSYSWYGVYENSQNRAALDEERAHCGPFSFEIRAWDIDTEGTEEISDTFDIEKNLIRKAIRTHKGISVYRDGVLVLPKSESSRDWLGLDLRRVSRIGTRLSTSQVVGYVSISAESNPKLKDTSDREHLASNQAVIEFEEILHSIVELLENERKEDKAKPGREKPLADLFGGLSADNLVAEISALADEGADVSDAMPVLRAFSANLDTARKSIQERFVYYSRLATIGTIAQMLVHEIRNRTIAFGGLLGFVKDRFGPINDTEFEKEYQYARNAVDALERLADTFAPLASRAFRRRLRNTILEERIRECLGLLGGEIKSKGIRVSVPDSETRVAVDPGELDSILLNLLTNACYWLNEVPKDARRIKFTLETDDGKKRVFVLVSDTGPGVDEEDLEKIFWPGVTKKPGGIGMGLTVASELVAEYGGRMGVDRSVKKGASFVFDLPLRE